MVCATIFAIHKRSYNLLTSLLGRQHLQRSNQVNKIFQRLLLMVKVSQMLRSTYRKSAERRSSVQKSKFDHNIIIRG